MEALAPLEFDFLSACHESVLRQAELLPLLADSLGVPPEKVFYHRVVSRCRQSGRIAGTDWRYFFHGLECDVEIMRDKRYLQIEFGPGGRYDTFSGWGVMQFVMRARAPWKEFPQLRQHLAKTKISAEGEGKSAPAYLSGSHRKMSELTGFLAGQSVSKSSFPSGKAPPKINLFSAGQSFH